MQHQVTREGFLSAAANDAPLMTWCCIQKLCMTSGQRSYTCVASALGLRTEGFLEASGVRWIATCRKGDENGRGGSSHMMIATCRKGYEKGKVGWRHMISASDG
jgi:hypothetical protein